MKNDKFKAMSDEELVAKANSRLWISGEEGQVAAELSRRRKIDETKNSSVQKQVRNMTIAVLIIAAITLFITMLQFFQSSLNVPLCSPDVKPHKEYNQPTDPNERKENTLGPVNIEKPIDKPIDHKLPPNQ